MIYRKILKPFIDVSIALIIFCISLPIFIVITLALFVANAGKPFFTQPRPGKNERIFKIIKFKTMNDRKDASGNLLGDDLRLTTVGKWVRKLSLDEIPQLLNVLKGDMSLIGPRPLLMEYLPLYSETQSRRHEVRPGITGWAQVNGRNAISWEKKFELDVWYIDNYSFAVDLRILLLTLKKVFAQEGISSDSTATMETFTGNK